MTRLVCISDTHRMHDRITVPDGDILVHAGDFLSRGELRELPDFVEWFAGQPHRHKVLVAGNHDECFEREAVSSTLVLRDTDITYLQDRRCTIEGLKFWGSPWQPEFFNWAFNLPRNGDELAARWSLIPDDTDVLITHGPPIGILDRTSRTGEHVGCERLTHRVQELRPRVHVFGHIHEGYDVHEHHGTVFVNAAVCTAGYQPTNAPIVIDVTPESVEVVP